MNEFRAFVAICSAAQVVALEVCVKLLLQMSVAAGAS